METKKELILMTMEDLRCIMHECIQQGTLCEKPKGDNELLSTEEVLERLKVSRPTLWRWHKSNYLKPIKIGSKNNYYKLSDVMKIEGVYEKEQ